MSIPLDSSDNLGFLTVIDHPRHGLVGGYLVLNSTGRPLEFHCTSPVKPNRAQEILYGNTLEPYLYGEQIAVTLLTRAKTVPRHILTDSAAVLAAQERIDRPIVYVFGSPRKKPQSDLFDWESDRRKETPEISDELNESLKSFGIENARSSSSNDRDAEKNSKIPEVAGLDTSRWQEFDIGHRTVAVPGVEEADRRALLDDLKTISRTVDLAEPFTRIRLAVEEAQRAA